MGKSSENASATGAGKKNGEKIPQKSPSTGKTAKQIMNKHIRDKNDVITDEDFKNLNIDQQIPEDMAHQPLQLSGNKKRPKDEDKDPETVTPWDVISE